MTVLQDAQPSIPREPLHHRRVDLHGYRRSDGLWDIEATMSDRRNYDSQGLEKGLIPAGDAVHDIRVCVTLDDGLVVRAATAHMGSVPYHTCPGALPAVSALVGATVGSGWRRQIEERLGGPRCCTHIRELLLQVATTAYQTIPVWHAQSQGDVVRGQNGQPPNHLGHCTAWAFDGPVVARHYPQFVNWKRPARADNR